MSRANGTPKPLLRPDKACGFTYNHKAEADRHFYLYDDVSDLVFEADGYLQPQAEDEDPSKQRWTIYLMCPACHQTLRLDSEKKPFEVTERGIETGEPIGCSYWLHNVDGYTGMCPFRGELQPPKSPEWGEVRTDVGVVRVKIDAWIRRAF